MQDRVPLYPGRIILTPVAGQANTYDMVRADQPTQDGTPLNKATFWKDATAALFGLGVDSVPDDGFQVLSKAPLYKTQPLKGFTKQINVNLATANIGDIVELPFAGKMRKHRVLHKGNPNSALYDSSCDGAWVAPIDIVSTATWSFSSDTQYTNSAIYSAAEGNLGKYADFVRNAIKLVKIPYCVGNGSSTVKSMANGHACHLFPLSGYELGWTQTTSRDFPIDGSVLSYFSGTAAIDQKRILTKDGVASEYWLRSQTATTTANVWYVLNNGGYNYNKYDQNKGVAYCFVLPADFSATFHTDEVGNYYETVSGLFDMSNNLLARFPGVQIESGSYVGTGTYGIDNANSLTFKFSPKIVWLLGMKGSTSVFNPIDLSDGESGVIPCDYLTTEYQNAPPYSGSAQVNYCYSKISADRRTIYWYNSNRNSGAQYNSQSTVYYYIAIG